MTHRRAVALMVLVTLLWSIAGVVTRHLDAARSFEVTFWRSFFCVLGVLLIMAVQQRGNPWGVVRRMGLAGILSGVMWAVMFTCFMVALTRTSTANTMLVSSISPLLAALLAWAVLGERIRGGTWLSIAAALAGIFWMVREGVSAQGLSGMLIAAGVPLASAVNLITLKKMHATVDLGPAVLIGAVLSSLITLPLALPFQASAHDLGLLFGLGLFQLAIPSSLAVVCARSLKAPEVALLGLLEVIFGILLAWVGAGEVPSREVLVGGGLVVGALAANEWLGWRQRNA